MIALHARHTAALDPAKGAMTAAKAPFGRSEAPFGPAGQSVPAHRLIASKPGVAAKSSGAPETAGDGPVGVRHAPPMDGIMRPDVAKAAMKIVEAIAMEEIGIQDD